MGIPKQVLDAESKFDAMMDGNSTPPSESAGGNAAVNHDGNDPLTAATQPTQEHNAAQHAQANESSQTAKDLQRMSSLFGRMKKAEKELDAKLAQSKTASAEDDRIEKLQNEISELKNLIVNNAIRQSANPAQGQREVERSKDDDTTTALQEELARMGYKYNREEVDSLSAVAKVIFGKIPEIGQLKSMSDRIAGFEKRESEKAEAGFFDKIEKSFPGLMEMDTNGDQTWTKFLSTNLPAPMSNMMYGDVAKDALARRDFDKFSEVVGVFQRMSGHVFSPAAINDPSGLAMPGSVNVRSEPLSRNKPVYSRSEVDAFRKAVLSKKAAAVYNLKPEDVEKVSQAYDDAEAEGRIIEG